MEKGYFDLMEQLVGENAVFPTMAELGRQAIREKIIREFKAIKLNNINPKTMINDNNTSKTSKQIILHEETIIQGNVKIKLRELGNAEL